MEEIGLVSVNYNHAGQNMMPGEGGDAQAAQGN